ncbi:MAG TPA: acryloyl-CoA reductase [Steroidobacteraceae bacterium]|nr:acryloyl-CoA reductase [Steroidobacteraceae bacterium]
MRFHALRIHQHNAGTQAQYQSMAVDELTPGEVLIRVQYSSINYKDALAVTGAGKILRRFPLNAGIDLAGIVETSEVMEFKQGQPVLVTGCGLSETLDGGYAEFARVPAAAVVPLPDGLTVLDAMTLGTAGFTAALAIHRLEHNGLQPGQGEVMVSGASGGVGSIAINMLAARGYEVTAITGRESQRDYLTSLGATQIVLRSALHMSGAPLEKTRIAGAIDNVGGELLSWLIRSLRHQGSVASIGLTGGSELRLSVMPFILRGVNLLGINSAATPRALREQVWQRIAGDLKPGKLEQIRTRVVGFGELTGIMPEYLRNETHGRTVVRISG